MLVSPANQHHIVFGVGLFLIKEQRPTRVQLDNLVGGLDMKLNEPVSIKSISTVTVWCVAAALGLVGAVWGVLGIFVL